MRFPFLPKRFTGSRMAQELDYLSQDLGEQDPTTCSVTDFLCYLNRSLSFFRPQFLICKMQVIALPWRVPCCQVLKKWWWWGQNNHRDKMMWIRTFSKTCIKRRFCLPYWSNYNHPAAPYNSIAKAVQRRATPQKRSCISLLHLPQIPTSTCWPFFSFFFFLLS